MGQMAKNTFGGLSNMAMTREEIQYRIVTGAEYIEREDITEGQREKARARYLELEQELNQLDEIEKAKPKTNVPENVQREIDKIREILKDAKPRNKPA